MTSNDIAPEMPQPCDEWHELITAAQTAGRWAACQVARRSTSTHLDLPGRVDVHIEPLASPVAQWLHDTGRAAVTASRSGVLVPVALTAADLHPAADAARKCGSLLVAHAYAVAYSDLLGAEAGAATEIRVAVDAQRRLRTARALPIAGVGETSDARPATAA